MLSNTPSNGDSNSSVDFSVSKVKINSPFCTKSPLRLCHCTIEPSVIVRPTFGISSSMSYLFLRGLLHRQILHRPVSRGKAGLRRLYKIPSCTSAPNQHLIMPHVEQNFRCWSRVWLCCCPRVHARVHRANPSTQPSWLLPPLRQPERRGSSLPECPCSISYRSARDTR